MPGQRGGELRPEADVGPGCIHGVLQIVIKVAVLGFALARVQFEHHAVEHREHVPCSLEEALLANSVAQPASYQAP